MSRRTPRLRPDGLPFVMTLAEACDYLRLSRWTVAAMLERGELAGGKTKGTWRVDTGSVVAWARGTRPATGT